MLAFGSLIVLLFVLMGTFLIDQKARELSSDISSSAQAFAELSSEEVMQAYSAYLKPGYFLAFRRELTNILRKNSDLSQLVIYGYDGELLYDSSTEIDAQYSGDPRVITEEPLLQRIQGGKSSLLLDDGRVVFLHVDENSELHAVDFNENPVPALQDQDRIADVVVPYENAYALRYMVSYEALDARLSVARIQIILIALLGILLTLMLSFVLSSSITNPLRDLKEGAGKIAAGDFSVRVKVKTQDELGVLAKTFNKMAKDLAASTDALLYQERVKKELDLASQIQKELLPKEKLNLKTLDMAGGLVPATEIGGDAFDYIPMKEPGHYLTYLGDVTGHGVPSGIISAIANAVLYGLRDETELSSIVQQLNDVIMEKTDRKLFLTMGLTVWDENTDTITYVNAGHPPILFYEAKTKQVKEIRSQGIALGMVPDLRGVVKEVTLKMSPNDAIVMYSDGIPEALNRAKKQYGMNRLIKITQDAAKDLFSAEGIKNAILSDVVAHIGGGEHMDDMTVLVMKRKET